VSRSFVKVKGRLWTLVAAGTGPLDVLESPYITYLMDWWFPVEPRYHPHPPAIRVPQYRARYYVGIIPVDKGKSNSRETL
jgi:hypothetical protein